MLDLRALRSAPLLVLLLWPLAPLRAEAQNMAAFVALAQRCRASGDDQTCRAALEQSHKLRTWAEARRLWRCYTGLLGAEAEMIAASRSPRHRSDATPALLEMRSICAAG
jgi:hypothetical protein